MDNSSNIIERKTKQKPSICKICGSSALYSYYGVVSCQSCKIFFRRNAQYGQILLKCHFNNQCEINVNNRHTCASCRLSKCFEQGMKIEMIRPSRTYKNKDITSKSLVKSNNIEYIPTLNLLENDNSLLNHNQWILLSNIIHSYDETKLFSISNRLKNENNNSLKIINPLIVQELLTGFYEITGIYLRLNNDINYLPFNDRSILLHTAADNITCLGGIFILYHSQLINDNEFWNYLESLYGILTMKYHRWSATFTESDIILFKLGLALFALSTNSRIFHKNISLEYTNIQNILNIQNKYVELTWKYLIYKYGYYEAIRKYIHLIKWFLSVSVFMSYAHNAQAHINDIETLIEQTELKLILDDVDRIE